MIALGKTVATAESCTGGLIANRLTNVPGSSEAFTHGWVTYANEAKIGQLHVPAETIETYGAVSEETARAMAEGALAESGSDLAISVTGIAGPSGGTDEKPVGTARKVFHPRNRKDFKQSVAQSALDLVRRNLTGLGS